VSRVADLGAASLPVAVRTLGCKVNRAESEAIAAQLLGAGVRIAEEDEAAVVVINTCTVTGEADAKARKAVRHALGAEHRPLVVVTGCLAALEREALAGLGERVIVEADKARVSRVVEELLGVEASHGGDTVPALPRAGDSRFRTRAALKIEDGCDNYCTYCIVPYARGVPRATPLAEVVAQAGALVASGTREIVLTGINIGRYLDRESGAQLADVLQEVAQSGVARIRLSSVEPLDLTPRLLEVMAATPAFCAHLHVPLQSGSDAILSAMGRRYTRDEFSACIAAARRALPGLVVTTDVLAGFPGETEAHAAETLAFCREIGFGKLHVFRYSPRPGTSAAARIDQVAPEAKTARAAALRALSTEAVAEHERARIGAIASVLVERIVAADDGTALAEGTTDDYLRVCLPPEATQAGELVSVELLGVDGGRVLGRLAD
jgi:threonylcarbamoyladenosine tRNA methylthiotransferase MtaB